MKTTPTQDDTFDVKVFREDPLWDKYDRWWKLPVAKLEELLVERYTCLEDDRLAHLAWIREQHPGCVLVYAGAGE